MRLCVVFPPLLPHTQLGQNRRACMWSWYPLRNSRIATYMEIPIYFAFWYFSRFWIFGPMYRHSFVSHHLDRTGPCKFLCVPWDPSPKRMRKKLQTGILRPCASAHQKPHPNIDYQPIFRAMTKKEPHHLDDAGPCKVFMRSLSPPSPRPIRKKLQTGILWPRACEQRKHPNKSDCQPIFRTKTKKKLHHLDRTGPCKFFAGSLGRLPKTHEEKMLTFIPWPRASAQKKQPTRKGIVNQFFVEWRKQNFTICIAQVPVNFMCVPWDSFPKPMRKKL